MPAYNAEAYIGAAIASVLAQSLADFELIIVDDASTDNTLRIIQSFKDDRIRLVKNKSNKGLIETPNKAVRLAQADLIARLDADDIAEPQRLAKQAQYFAHHPKLVALGSWFIEVNEAGHHVRANRPPVSDYGIRQRLMWGTCFGQSTVMMRRVAFIQVGGYRDKVPIAEDYDLWTRLAEVGKMANLPEMLVKYRINTVGVSARQPELHTQKAAEVRDSRWAAEPPAKLFAETELMAEWQNAGKLGPEAAISYKSDLYSLAATAQAYGYTRQAQQVKHFLKHIDAVDYYRRYLKVLASGVRKRLRG